MENGIITVSKSISHIGFSIAGFSTLCPYEEDKYDITSIEIFFIPNRKGIEAEYLIGILTDKFKDKSISTEDLADGIVNIIYEIADPSFAFAELTQQIKPGYILRVRAELGKWPH